MSWPPTGNAKLDDFLAKLGAMTASQVDAALDRHDAIEHELETPNWNRKSALLLHRKIELRATAHTRRPHESDETAQPVPSTTVPQSEQT